MMIFSIMYLKTIITINLFVLIKKNLNWMLLNNYIKKKFKLIKFKIIKYKKIKIFKIIKIIKIYKSNFFSEFLYKSNFLIL